MAHKGRFRPMNPSKYAGDHTNIIYRSRWEARYMSFLDRATDVVEWSSEEFFIPYKCKTDKKWHRYFPDFKVKWKTKDGKTITQVVEIKPRGQVARPELPKKQTPAAKRRYLNECFTYAKNKSKWEYAEDWCKNRGYKFIILTERELGLRF